LELSQVRAADLLILLAGYLQIRQKIAGCASPYADRLFLQC
jgi:hypothetical protein